MRIDVYDPYRTAYNYGLYPLPDDGKWVISYPGHHVAVWRRGEEFLVMDSIKHFEGPGGKNTERWTILKNGTEYVNFVHEKFPPTYSYIVFYSKHDLDNVDIYKLIMRMDIDNWVTRRLVANSWGDFDAEKIANPAKYNPTGQVFLPPHHHRSADIDDVSDYFPLGGFKTPGKAWLRATYELQGLSEVVRPQSEPLLRRREYLEKYMDTIEKSLNKRDLAWEGEIRNVIGEGRIVVNPYEYINYSKTSPKIKQTRRSDWIIVLDYLMHNWAEKFVSDALDSLSFLPSGTVVKTTFDNLKRSWNNTLLSRIMSELKQEFMILANAEWEYIPLSRPYFDEVVRLIKQGKGYSDGLLNIIERWAPAGVELGTIVGVIPAPNITQIQTKVRGFTSGAKELLEILFPALAVDVTLTKIRQRDIVFKLENVPYLHEEFKDFLCENYPGTLIDPDTTGTFFAYVPANQDPYYILSEDTLPWSIQDLYDYMESVAILNANLRWNPMAVVQQVDHQIAEAISTSVGLIKDRTREPGGYVLTNKWHALLSQTLADGAFAAPKKVWIENREDALFNDISTDEFAGYNDAKSSWLAYTQITHPDKICSESFGPYVLPIYHNNLQDLASLQSKVQDFRQRTGYTTKYDNYETILMRTLGTPNPKNGQILDMSSFETLVGPTGLGSVSIPNPIPYQVWIDPEALDEALRFVPALTEDDQLLMDYVKKLFTDQLIFDVVWQIAAQAADATHLPLGRIWTIILRAYRRRRLPMLENVLDFKTLQKIIVLEQLEDVQAEIRKTSKEILTSKLEERLVRPDVQSSEIVTARVFLKTFRDPLGPNHPDRTYYYRWRFESAGKSGYKKSREWYDGPTDTLESIAEIPVLWGEGILSCEAYILRKKKGGLLYVDRAACPHSLRLRILHQCARCEAIYSENNNHHGSCVFHPIPNPTQSFLMNQRLVPNEARNWNFYVQTLSHAIRNVLSISLEERSKGLPAPTHMKSLGWFVELAQKLEISEDDIEILSFDLALLFEKYPFGELLNLLERFPWADVVETKQAKASIPSEVRFWMTQIPAGYIRSIFNKWISFKKSHVFQREGYEGITRDGLMRLVPTNFWIDEETTAQFKRSIRPMPYGYDYQNGRWLCCGKEGSFAAGCWVDKHSETYPYVRFFGHKEHGDIRGSWAIERRPEFAHLWEKFEVLFGTRPIPIEALQTLAMRYYSLQLNLSGYGQGETIYWPYPRRKCDIELRYPKETLVVVPGTPKKALFAAPIGVASVVEVIDLVSKPKKGPGYMGPKKGIFVLPPIPGFTPLHKPPPPTELISETPKYIRAGPGSPLPLDNSEGTRTFVSAMPYLSLALAHLVGVKYIEAMPMLSLAMVPWGMVGETLV